MSFWKELGRFVYQPTPPPPPEDPAVARIEQILTRAQSTQPMTPQPGRAKAEHALWICPCYTEGDAPVWLIHDGTPLGIVWQRIPARSEPLDLVDARLIAGGHTDTCDVLDWLEERASDPWATGDAFGRAKVWDRIRDRILASD